MDKLLGPDAFKNLMSKDLQEDEKEDKNKLNKVLGDDNPETSNGEELHVSDEVQTKTGIKPSEEQEDGDDVSNGEKPANDSDQNKHQNDYIRWQIKDGIAELTGSEPDMDILLGSAITVASTITGKGRHDFCTKCCRLFGWDLSQLNNDIKNGNITQEDADQIMAKSVVDQCQIFLDLVNKEEPSSYRKETFSDERVTSQEQADDQIAEEEDVDN